MCEPVHTSSSRSRPPQPGPLLSGHLSKSSLPDADPDLFTPPSSPHPPTNPRCAQGTSRGGANVKEIVRRIDLWGLDLSLIHISEPTRPY